MTSIIIMMMIKLMLIITTIWMLMQMLMFKMKSLPKNLSPFECGFNMFSSNMPLSIQFTLLTFIFLLFDIELSILISSNWKINNINKNWIMTIVWFLMLMMISIIYEMLKKALKWN